nr:phage tail assembly protein [Escherichia coli]
MSQTPSDTFKLSYPFTTAAGTRIELVELKRLTVKDLKQVRKISKNPAIRRQLVLPTRANYTGRTLQCDIKSRLLLPSLSFSCSFHLSVRTYIRDGSAGLPPPPP